MVKIVQIDWKKEEKTGELDEKSVLRQEAKEVLKKEFGTEELKKIIEDMQEAMKREDDGVAIAAPQIGIAKRIFCIKESAYEMEKKEFKWKPLVFINPKIKKASKKVVEADEGCLSVRPLYGTTIRHTNITLEAQDINGVKFTFGASGLIAHIFQHECDHLEGILFIDHADNIQKVDLEQIKKELKNEEQSN
ncbi:Peptide deformylase 2 [bioreactor metagenome]|uniref:Peptide deformylase 2 n=1 Tax=bioreactor metagenome TaxID=1076179 RepID=A0A644T5D1_9ZZZZ|nr:peptide deformylase [Candidatus Elulimicrobiales bacterium]